MKLKANRSLTECCHRPGGRRAFVASMQRWILLSVSLAFFSTPALAQFSATGSSPDNPQTNLVPIGPPPAPYPPSGYGSFDPYANTASGGFGGGSTAISGVGIGSAGIGPPVGLSPQPSAFPSTGQSGGSLFGGLFSQPASSPMPSAYSAPAYGAPTYSAPTYSAPTYSAPTYSAPTYSDPAYGAPSYGPPSFQYDNSNVYGPPTAYGAPSSSFPSTIYPQSSPTTLFPEGLFRGTIFPGNGADNYSAYRLLRGPRFRHGYVGFGDDPNDLNTNDTDVSVVFAFPNFLYTNQPFYVVPSFSLHLWDGPKSSAKGADLPGSAYSAFLDLGWNSDPNQMFSTELGVRVGSFSDFDTFNSDSIRIMGKALASFRLTPTSTLKGGVYYLDRNNLKLVPAGGLLWQPNPITRFDIFFPQPKFARYASTIGTQDVWWYLSGDYGGGTWTVTRASGQEDSVDMNDLRAVLGLEWGRSDEIRAGRRLGFFEVGYVFNRELKYKKNPANDLDLDDGMMFRLGIGY